MAALLILLCLIATHTLHAQWSDDPQEHIRCSCGIYGTTSGNSSLCSDGLGGIFFATGFSTGGWADERRLWLVHINADGYTTLQGDECTDMIRIDNPEYSTGHETARARLIPSEPPGTLSL